METEFQLQRTATQPFTKAQSKVLDEPAILRTLPKLTKDLASTSREHSNLSRVDKDANLQDRHIKVPRRGAALSNRRHNDGKIKKEDIKVLLNG